MNDKNDKPSDLSAAWFDAARMDTDINHHMERVASIGWALADCVVGPLVAAGMLVDERADDRPDPDDAAEGSAEYYLYDPGTLLHVSAQWYGVVVGDEHGRAIAVMFESGDFQVFVVTAPDGRYRARIAAISAREQEVQGHPTLEGAIANPIRWK